MYNYIFFLVASYFVVGEAKHLPSYIKPCKRDDPNLQACVKQHAEDAIPSILKGDKEYKYPPLVPFHLSTLSVNPNDNLKFTLKDIEMTGMETAKIEEIVFDPKKQHIHVKLAFSYITILSQYEIDGRILILPIKGSGPANVTSENLVLDYDFDYKLIKKEDGKEYMDTNISPKVSYTLEKNHFQFGNLFNGNKELEKRFMEFVEANREELTRELTPVFTKVINEIVTNYLIQILPLVPYSEIFI